MSTIFVDNTNIVRVSGAKLTTITGASSLVTEPGTYTLFDVNGVEVVGQSWPSDLVLNSPGEYAGFLEADLALIVGDVYTLEVTLGSGDLRSAKWTCTLKPVHRNC